MLRDTISSEPSNTMATTPPPSSLKPVDRPLNLIPVGLKEAALDSPTFRATSTHFFDQIDAVERWLENYVRAASKLVAEVSNLETLVNAFLAQSTPPPGVNEAVLDQDYTLLCMRRYGEGSREFWSRTLGGVKKYEHNVVEPIRGFLVGELRGFKESRRVLEQSQKSFDTVMARYLGQSKAKEASSLREDAFQVHEARRAYLKASMDVCTSAPQLRASLDNLLVRVFTEQWREMRANREATQFNFQKMNAEMERVRGWSKDMETSEKAFRRELLAARKQIEDAVNTKTRPSRELADYEVSTVPYLGAGTGSATGINATSPGLQERGEKQGWLVLKTIVGKAPTRTLWSRRWFFVKNGIFGWLTTSFGGVAESEKIGVLLCGIRPAFNEERRFCFEVKTKDSSIILQAETQAELTEWLAAFEIVKRRALEDPASRDSSPISPGNDPAFAISPPIAPEFAARMPDGSGHGEGEGAPASAAGLAAPEMGVVNRASFDVAGSTANASAAKRVMSIEREPGEGSRDHAARIIQKLDLHKRGVASTQLSQPSPGMPSGGIASLISASHNILPVRPEGFQPPASPADPSGALTPGLPGHKRGFSNIPLSTLAPSTLAIPPAPTNLSHTAVVISGERGIGTSGPGGMPGGIQANLWGSNVWGVVNKIGDDIPPSKREALQQSKEDGGPGSVSQKGSVDDVNVMDGEGQMSQSVSKEVPDGIGPGNVMHRKTMSIDASTGTPSMGQLQPAAASTAILPQPTADEYPNYYPLPLKAQNAQFRMLFPAVPRSEKLVLVFRATWNPTSEQQEFPGRVYVTERDIYFYSNYMGLVLITSVSLGNIKEVTGASGCECDFLYLHLKHGKGNDMEVGVGRRITVRVFLDQVGLLRRRLEFLARNADSDTPVGLEEVIKTLIKMEAEKPERSSSIESWEELGLDDAEPGAPESPSHRKERNIKTSLRIDGALYGEPRTGREVQRFQLPRQPVIYAPQGMTPGVTRDYSVSAKALFHVVFGDKSAVWQLLYTNRWADKIVQSPWVKPTDGHWARKFESEGHATPMSDSQRIDVMNDHLCYVVTNTKIPWRLPYASSKRFYLLTKLVITHVAKSKSRLAIFQNIVWTKQPKFAYFRQLVEKQAMRSLEADALDLTNVAFDQVAKLAGKGESKTNKAVEIFGGIGQQSSSSQLDVGSVPNLGGSLTTGREKARKPISLPGLVLADALDKMLAAVTLAFDVLVAISKGAGGLLTAHTFLVAVLLVSVLYNSWNGYRDGLVWWHERSATRYMARLGVKPEPVLRSAVYLRDVEEMVAPPSIADNANNTLLPPWLPEPPVETQTSSGKSCRTTFSDHLTTSLSTASGSQSRLHRSRDALAKYRHDLLVALRVVNRIERDVVSAEWEDWVHAEERKCARVESMLHAKVKEGKQDVDVAVELGPEFQAYCQSCKSEVEGLRNESLLALS